MGLMFWLFQAIGIGIAIGVVYLITKSFELPVELIALIGFSAGWIAAPLGEAMHEGWNMTRRQK